jgi:hypothetical protein
MSCIPDWNNAGKRIGNIMFYRYIFAPVGGQILATRGKRTSMVHRHHWGCVNLPERVAPNFNV